MANGTVAGLPTPGDLQQAAGDGDEQTALAGAAIVSIALKPDGTICVFPAEDYASKVEVASMDEALQTAGKMAQELAVQESQNASQDEQMARPGNADAQSMWDQMASQRPQRGNT